MFLSIFNSLFLVLFKASLAQQMWDNIIVSYVSAYSLIENSPGLDITIENFPSINFLRMEKLSFLQPHLFPKEQALIRIEGLVDTQAGDPVIALAPSNLPKTTIDLSKKEPNISEPSKSAGLNNMYKPSGWRQDPTIKTTLQNAEKRLEKLNKFVEPLKTSVEKQHFYQIMRSEFEQVQEANKLKCYLDIVKALEDFQSGC